MWCVSTEVLNACVGWLLAEFWAHHSCRNFGQLMSVCMCSLICWKNPLLLCCITCSLFRNLFMFVCLWLWTEMRGFWMLECGGNMAVKVAAEAEVNCYAFGHPNYSSKCPKPTRMGWMKWLGVFGCPNFPALHPNLMQNIAEQDQHAIFSFL